MTRSSRGHQERRATCRARLLAAGAVTLVAVAPVVLRAPRADVATPHGVRTIDDAVRHLRATGLEGWQLVDAATALVHRKFTHYSAWHVWETPARAFEHSRGQSVQYNRALAEILQRLGFHVQVVHAARVRAGANPWFHAGHVWLRVTVDGRTRDVSAADADDRAGAVHFVPVSEVRPIRPWTPTVVTVAHTPLVVRDVWMQVLQRRPASHWLYRPFGERA